MRWSPASARMPPAANLAARAARSLSSWPSVVNQGRARIQRHQSNRADRARGDSLAGLDQAGTQAKLMPDAHLEIAPASQG